MKKKHVKMVKSAPVRSEKAKVIDKINYIMQVATLHEAKCIYAYVSHLLDQYAE